jgi:hypothetical protein
VRRVHRRNRAVLGGQPAVEWEVVAGETPGAAETSEVEVAKTSGSTSDSVSGLEGWSKRDRRCAPGWSTSWREVAVFEEVAAARSSPSLACSQGVDLAFDKHHPMKLGHRPVRLIWRNPRGPRCEACWPSSWRSCPTVFEVLVWHLLPGLPRLCSQSPRCACRFLLPNPRVLLDRCQAEDPYEPLRR